MRCIDSNGMQEVIERRWIFIFSDGRCLIALMRGTEGRVELLIYPSHCQRGCGAELSITLRYSSQADVPSDACFCRQSCLAFSKQ